MALRPRGYGLSAEVKRKMDGKYDPEQEQGAREWIEAVLGRSVSEKSGALGQEEMQTVLKDGRILCELMNQLEPGSCKKINESKMAFKQMENISKFLASAEAYGVSRTDLFQTVDLFEKQNMAQVICTIHALGRKAQTHGFTGPVLGPKESAANVREFSVEQLRAGESVIGLQAGSNKGASQAGMNMGKNRAILD